MEIRNVEEKQGALTVICNRISSETSIGQYIEDVYSTKYTEQTVSNRSRQCLFIPKETDDIYGYIAEKIKKAEISIPQNGRMLIAWFLDIEQLTDEWIEKFLETAHNLKKSTSSDDIHKQMHIICMRNFHGRLSEDVRAAISRRLCQLAFKLHSLLVKDTIIETRLYLLRGELLVPFDDQEKAMARMIYLLSRSNFGEIRDWWEKEKRYALRLVNGRDYQRKKLEQLRKEEEELEQWLISSTDSAHKEIVRRIRSAYDEIQKVLEGEIRSFSQKIPIFPVNVEDFSGNFIFGYKSEISESHPIIKQIGKDILTERGVQSVKEVDLSALKKLVEEEYGYRDIEGLNRWIEEKTFLGNLKKELDVREEDEAMAENFIRRCLEVIRPQVAAGKERKETSDSRLLKIKLEINRLQDAENGNEDYSTLESCLNSIVENSSFLSIHGRIGENQKKMLLINANLADEVKKLEERRRFVPDNSDADKILYCDAISPYDAAAVRECEFVVLEDEKEKAPAEDQYEPDAKVISWLMRVIE